MKLCECGCGAEVKRRFLPGHQQRVIWTEDRRRRQGELAKARGANPPDHTGRKFPGRGQGKKRSEEACRRISEGIRNSPKTKANGERMRLARMGENNPNWQGGKAKEPYAYEWTKELKAIIRERDGGICQSCGHPPCKKFLDVHHIDGNKKNCDPANLITLCHTCHQKWHGGTDIPIERRQLDIPVITPPPPKPQKEKYANLREEAGRLYDQGNSVSAVAEIMGYKPATVNYWLRTGGYTRNYEQAQALRREREKTVCSDKLQAVTSKAIEASRQKRLAASQDIRQEALNRYASGQSSNTIGHELGINKGTVAYWAKGAGIVRSKSEAQRIRRSH